MSIFVVKKEKDECVQIEETEILGRVKEEPPDDFLREGEDLFKISFLSLVDSGVNFQFGFQLLLLHRNLLSEEAARKKLYNAEQI